MEKVGQKQKDIRETNKKLIIKSLLKVRVKSIGEFENELGLSHTAIQKILGDLYDKRIVVQAGIDNSCVGRPVRKYHLNRNGALTFAVYVGRNIRTILTDMVGIALDRFSYDENDFAENKMKSFLNSALPAIKFKEKERHADLLTVCIAIDEEIYLSYGKGVADIFEKFFKENFDGVDVYIKSQNDFWGGYECFYGDLFLSEGVSILAGIGRDALYCSIVFDDKTYSPKAPKSIGKISFDKKWKKNETDEEFLSRSKQAVNKLLEYATLSDANKIIFFGSDPLKTKNLEKNIKETAKENKSFGGEILYSHNHNPAMAGAIFLGLLNSINKLEVNFNKQKC